MVVAIGSGDISLDMGGALLLCQPEQRSARYRDNGEAEQAMHKLLSMRGSADSAQLVS